MVITYHGENCVRIQSGETSILVDPTNNRLKGDMVIRTLCPLTESPLATSDIRVPGEYEVKGIAVRGIAVPEESTEKFLKIVYHIEFEDITLALFGHISKMPNADVLEKMGEPDIMIVPAGGAHMLSVADATTLVKKIEPGIVIPIAFASTEALSKALGQKMESADRLTIKKKDIVPEQGKVMVLENSSQ